MTKEQLTEAIIAHYEELNALNKIDNFYDYEGDFIKLTQAQDFVLCLTCY